MDTDRESMTTRSLKITEYQRPEEFLFLLQKNPSTASEKNDFMLGLVHLLTTDPYQFKTKPLLATATEQDKIQLAVFMTPPWPLVLFAESMPTPQLWSDLIDYLKQRNLPVSGVNAEKNLSERFAQEWCKTNTCQKNIKMTMKFFHYTKSNPSTLAADI